LGVEHGLYRMEKSLTGEEKCGTGSDQEDIKMRSHITQDFGIVSDSPARNLELDLSA